MLVVLLAVRLFALEVLQSTTGASIDGPKGQDTNKRSYGPRVHLVKAGAGGFKFEPAELTNVSVGDTVTFEFYPPDHSVARAEFGKACVPYETTGQDKIGFWSGTQWVATANDVGSHQLTLCLYAS